MDDVKNTALKIDSGSRDLVFDSAGNFAMISGDDTTCQAIRLTLQAWKEDFPLDIYHGTDYEAIVQVKASDLMPGEREDIITEAIFQETEVKEITSLGIIDNKKDRSMDCAFTAVLADDTEIEMEVPIGE